MSGTSGRSVSIDVKTGTRETIATITEHFTGGQRIFKGSAYRAPGDKQRTVIGGLVALTRALIDAAASGMTDGHVLELVEGWARLTGERREGLAAKDALINVQEEFERSIIRGRPSSRETPSGILGGPLAPPAGFGRETPRTAPRVFETFEHPDRPTRIAVLTDSYRDLARAYDGIKAYRATKRRGASTISSFITLLPIMGGAATIVGQADVVVLLRRDRTQALMPDAVGLTAEAKRSGRLQEITADVDAWLGMLERVAGLAKAPPPSPPAVAPSIRDIMTRLGRNTCACVDCRESRRKAGRSILDPRGSTVSLVPVDVAVMVPNSAAFERPTLARTEGPFTINRVRPVVWTLSGDRSDEINAAAIDASNLVTISQSGFGCARFVLPPKTFAAYERARVAGKVIAQ